jgi:hypothetical protein
MIRDECLLCFSRAAKPVVLKLGFVDWHNLTLSSELSYLCGRASNVAELLAAEKSEQRWHQLAARPHSLPRPVVLMRGMNGGAVAKTCEQANTRAYN